MFTPDSVWSRLVRVACTVCSVLSWLDADALTAAWADTRAVALSDSVAGAAYGALRLPSGRRHEVAPGACATPDCACAPRAKLSTRLIIVVKPAGPPAGFVVKAEAPVGEPTTSWLPSRSKAGAAMIAGLTCMTEANP